MRASRPGDTFLASLVVMSASRWGGVCFAGRCGDDEAADTEVRRSAGGDLAGRISAVAAGGGTAGAGLLLRGLGLGSVVDGALIEHFCLARRHGRARPPAAVKDARCRRKRWWRASLGCAVRVPQVDALGSAATVNNAVQQQQQQQPQPQQ
tara:strand:+ start:13070 stop:13522 length:453 start_codon:yes stop_codon:yes gene_type:complete